MTRPPPLANAPGSWTTQAACQNADTQIFYPEHGQRANLAKAICAACPVTAQCLTWAVATGEQYGVWGGLSEEERARLRTRTVGRRNRLAAAS